MSPRRLDLGWIDRDRELRDASPEQVRRKMLFSPRLMPGQGGGGDPDGLNAYSAALHTLVFSEDFSGFSSVADWGSTSHGSTPRLVPQQSPAGDGRGSTDAGVFALGASGSGYSGGTTRYGRIMYDGSDDNGPAIKSIQLSLSAALHDGSVECLWEWRVRVTPSSPFTSTIPFKNFLAYHWNDQAKRVEFDYHDHLAGPGSTNPSTHDTVLHFFDGGLETQNQGQQPVGPWFNEDIAVGQWFHIIAQYKCSSGIGARDGYARMKINGTKVIDVSQGKINVTPPGGDKEWCKQDDVDAILVDDGLSGEMFFGSVQTNPSQSWFYDLSDFKMYVLQ